MEQTRDELIQNLDYTKGMLLKMQDTLSKYLQMEKNLRNRQVNLPTTGENVTKRQRMIMITIAAYCGYTLRFILFGLYEHSAVSIPMFIGAAIYAGITYLYWKQSEEYFGKEKPKKGMKRRLMRFMEIYAIGTMICMFIDVASLICTLIGAAIAFPLVRRIRYSLDQKNLEIDQYNKNVEESNALIQQQRAELHDQYQKYQQELTENTAGWYPPDYYSLDACEFFLQAVRNFRAENIKEAVNLFEQTEEQKKMLEYQRQQNQKLNQVINGQQEMAGQLRFANMMNVLSYFQLGAMNANINAMNTNISAMNTDINANIQKNTNAVESLHRWIRNR